MSSEEAQIYADAVIENLVSQGVLPEDRYGRMTEAQREECAAVIVEKSEE